MKTNFKKTFLFGFAMLLVVSFILSYIRMLRVDEDYTNLIDDELQNMVLIQKITSESINNYFILRNMLAEKDFKQIIEMKDAWLKQTDTNTTYMNSIARLRTVQMVSSQSYHYLTIARNEYLNKSQEFFDLVTTDDKPAASKYFTDSVETSFFNYQNQISNFTFMNKSQISIYSNKISGEIRFSKFGFKVLGVHSTAVYLFLILLLNVLFIFHLYKIVFEGNKDKKEKV